MDDKVRIKLIQKLTKYGTVQICKTGYVFTLLMTADVEKGENLASAKTYMEIQMKVIESVGDKYPVVETMKNDRNYYMVVLKPRTDE